jgi:cell division protein FtsB
MTQVITRLPDLGQADPPRRQRRFPLVAVVLLAGLAITLAGIFPFRQMIAQQRQVDQTEARLNALVIENGRLEGAVAALQSISEVERLAREEHGLVRPGETAYIVDQEDEPVGPVRAAAPEEEPLDGRSMLERAWDFLTGRDLVPDE